MEDQGELFFDVGHAAFTPVVTPVSGADPDVVAIGQAYWKLSGFDDHGTALWEQSVASIDTWPWTQAPHVVAAAGTRAVLANRTCYSCGGMLSLTSRDALDRVRAGKKVSCVECDPKLASAGSRLTAVPDLSGSLAAPPADRGKRDMAVKLRRLQGNLESAEARLRETRRNLDVSGKAYNERRAYAPSGAQTNRARSAWALNLMVWAEALVEHATIEDRTKAERRTVDELASNHFMAGLDFGSERALDYHPSDDTPPDEPFR